MKTGVYDSAWYQKLVACIGLESTRKLIAKYGGTSIPVPRVNVFLPNQRDIMVTKDYISKKYLMRELASKWSLSQKTIRKIVDTTLNDPANHGHLYD